MRMKAPTTKLQIPKNFQSPNFKLWRAGLIQCLELGVWDFFGVCVAGFGVSFYHLASGLNRRALDYP